MEECYLCNIFVYTCLVHTSLLIRQSVEIARQDVVAIGRHGRRYWVLWAVVPTSL